MRPLGPWRSKTRFVSVLAASAFGLGLASWGTSLFSAERGQNIVLTYRETANHLQWVQLHATPSNSPFAKEPALQSVLLRGALRFGDVQGQDLAFLWSTSERILWLDLNRNGDLTDEKPFESSSRSGYYQTFSGVRVPFQSPDGIETLQFEFMLHPLRNTASGYAQLQSYWEGKLTLGGKDWQVGMIAGPSGLVKTNARNRGDAFLLIRPWGQKESAFSVNDNSGNTVAWPENLFLCERGYRIECQRTQASGAAPVWNLVLRPQAVETGELQLAGKYIDRLLLISMPPGTWAVVLDQPPASVRVPVGTYNRSEVRLKAGDREAYLDANRNLGLVSQVSLTPSKPAVMAVGGPLTNSALAARRGGNLSLRYELRGMGGVYRLVGSRQNEPPRWTIYKKGRKIDSGSFQFG